MPKLPRELEPAFKAWTAWRQADYLGNKSAASKAKNKFYSIIEKSLINSGQSKAKFGDIIATPKSVAIALNRHFTQLKDEAAERKK